jgi:CBS domain-containing protein
VVWTRGSATGEVAALLSDGSPVRVEGDLREACIAGRADILVTKKLSSFDLVSAVAPYKVDPARIGGVAAAVGSGPNSTLAAEIAHRLCNHLGVPGTLITAPPPGTTEASARALLDDVARDVPGMARAVQTDGGAASIVERVGDETLLILGEPGGSWLHRQFFGPGRKLIHAAPTGALVVRAAPTRVFRFTAAPAYVGAAMHAGDAVKVTSARVVPVVDDGELIGIVRRSRLVDADPARPVDELMEPPLALDQEDTLDAAWGLAATYEGAPIPVIDGGGTLVGTIDPNTVGIGN